MWRGYGEICIGYQNKYNKSETIMTTNQVKDVMGNLVVKLGGLNVLFILNTQLSLYENNNNFGGKLNDINYMRTVRKVT